MTSLLDDLHLGDGLQLIVPRPSDQELWRREFEYAGYGAVKRIVSGTNDWNEPRRQFASRWLKEKDSEIARRDKQLQLDTDRIDNDIDELRQDLDQQRQDLACLQEETARLREDAARMQRGMRRVLLGLFAAVVIAALGLCASIGQRFGGTRWDPRPTDFLLSAPLSSPGVAAADAGKVEQADQPVFKRGGRRRIVRLFAR
jgi:hypothetical protein